MDPVSQGALGAAAALVVARPATARKVAVLGALSGMAPDLDALIRSSSDPLLALEYHRQFTHALLFIPFGALLCSMVVLPFVRDALPRAVVYTSCFLGYASHGLLDACTSYGTQLFWPFSDHRVSWNIVSVVDPILTVVLLSWIASACIRRSPRLARVALAWVLGYLLLGVAQRERAEATGEAVALERGHTPHELTAKPAFGSLLVWKTVYRHSERYYVDAVRLGWSRERYPGQSAPALDLSRDVSWLQPKSQQARDVERFRWFSDGFLAVDPSNLRRITDVRYSLVPNRIEALWGIELDAAAADDAHVRFFATRGVSEEHREELKRMLLGR